MDWLSTIVGATIGFLASIGTMLVQQGMDKAGKLKLYCVVVKGDDPIVSVGFKTSITEPGMISFLIPIKLEIQNTSNTCRVIRDVSMWLYEEEKPVAEMVQIQNVRHTQSTSGKVTSESTSEYGADKNMYSFVIQPRSIQREHCTYAYKIKKEEIGKYMFDDIRLSYYDEKDIIVSYIAKEKIKGWKMGEQTPNIEWIKLSKRVKK